MSEGFDQWEPLRAVLTPLAEALPDITLVGGWAFRLYERHPDAGTAEIEPIMTNDTDLVLSPSVIVDLRAALEDANFETISGGMTTPRLETFRATVGGEEVEVEFLCNRLGGGVNRKGEAVPFASLGNVTAQRLPHLDLLTDHAIELELPPSAVHPALRVRVAHPAAFVIHKLMVLRSRAAAKRPKDLRYVHDILMRFADQLDAWHGGLRGVLPAPKSAKGGAQFIDWDMVVRASMIGRPIPPGRFLEELRAGLTVLDPKLVAALAVQPR